MDNDFFINEEYRNYIESLNDDIKSAFIKEFTEKKSENKDTLLHDKIFDEAWEIEKKIDIEENRKLLEITLFAGGGCILTLPLSTIQDLVIADINNRMEFSYIRDEYSYQKDFFCGKFSLSIKKDKLTEDETDLFLTMPGISGVILTYENHQDECYFFPYAYKKGKEILLLDTSKEDDFDYFHGNNLCQIVEEYDLDNLYQLSINEANITKNKKN